MTGWQDSFVWRGAGNETHALYLSEAYQRKLSRHLTILIIHHVYNRDSSRLFSVVYKQYVCVCVLRWTATFA